MGQAARITVTRTNAHGRQGYLTESQSLLPDPDPLSSLSINEELPDEAVPDPPTYWQLNDNQAQTVVPSKPLKPKRKRQNMTSVCVLALIDLI
jgi:hypothetical protein